MAVGDCLILFRKTPGIVVGCTMLRAPRKPPSIVVGYTLPPSHVVGCTEGVELDEPRSHESLGTRLELD